MAKTRLYELARELGVENKILIDACEQIGFEGKGSHSSSLSDDEAEKVRRFVIRSAVSGKGQKEREITKDGATLAVKRVGTVIRRRKKSEEEEEAAALAAAEAEQVDQTQDEENDFQVEADEELVASSEVEAAEVNQEISEDPEQIQEQAASATDYEELPTLDISVVDSEEIGIDELRRKHDVRAPKILGKIELPRERVVVKETRAKAPATTTTPGGDTGSAKEDRTRGKGKRGKEVVISDDDDGFGRRGDRKKKKQILGKGDLLDYGNERSPRRGGKKEKKAKDKDDQTGDIVQGVITVKVDGEISVGELSKSMGVKAGEVLKYLMSLGMMTTINQLLDFDTAALVADEFGVECVNVAVDYDEMVRFQQTEDAPEDLQSRPPVVTVMGHVDHGKTSLLDAIRKTQVASGEAGGITQHIGAYTVTVPSGGRVTFLDTPGHEAFTQMRARGAEVTDIVILIVAADDGVMPQTIEAINHAKAANVPIIVAINKMDKPDANPDKIKAQIADYGLVPEDWGGDTIIAPLSAHTGLGLPELLENLALQSEILELKANPNRPAVGTVVESKIDRGRGPVMTILIKNGTLRKGDFFIAGSVSGRVRALVGSDGKPLDEAGPSIAVEVLGASSVPDAGDDFLIFADEQQAKAIADERAAKKRQRELAERSGVSAMKSGGFTLERLSEMVTSGEVQELALIIKADVQGSVEALAGALQQLSNDQVRINIIHKAVGGVSENDVQLSSASKALIIGFNVRADSRAAALAESEGIEIVYSRVIYELVDTVKSVMTGLLAPEFKEKSLARAEVRQTFRVPKLGLIAGCYVLEGKVERGAKVRLLRDNTIVFEGKMASLRRFKEDVKEVAAGYECGIGVEGYQDIKDGDVIEIFKVEEVKATLLPGNA